MCPGVVSPTVIDAVVFFFAGEFSVKSLWWLVRGGAADVSMHLVVISSSSLNCLQPAATSPTMEGLFFNVDGG